MSEARIRFANGPLDDVAWCLHQSHPRAGQYLAQAPILAVLVCQKLGCVPTYGEVDRFGAAVAAEPRLRDLLASYGSLPQMRKLDASALKPGDREVLAALGRLDASTLAQAIPSDSQRVWLDGIRSWLRLAPSKKKDREAFSVAWIARRLGENLSRFEQVDALVDWIGRGNGVLNERWTWDRALSAVEAWHRALRDEAAQRSLAADRKRAATFDTIICKSLLPNVATVDGYDFTVLRSVRALRDEGAALHHCVASYAGEVARGGCAIVSVRKGGVGVATLQIDSRGTVAQLKGHCNAAPSPAARKACDLYALVHWRAPDAAA